MCVHVCVCMRVCVCACVHVCEHACEHVCVCSLYIGSVSHRVLHMYKLYFRTHTLYSVLCIALSSCTLVHCTWFTLLTPDCPHTTPTSVSVQQKAVKQLQSIMASLPVANRPKTAQEIRDFVQRYSSLISQLQSANLPTTSSIQSTKVTSTPQKPITSSQPTKKSAPSSVPVVVPLNFSPAPSSTSAMPPSTTSQLSISNSAMAQVDQHFQNSLSVAKVKPLGTGPTPPKKPHARHRETSIRYSVSSHYDPIYGRRR